MLKRYLYLCWRLCRRISSEAKNFRILDCRCRQTRAVLIWIPEYVATDETGKSFVLGQEMFKGQTMTGCGLKDLSFTSSCIALVAHDDRKAWQLSFVL
jgi:hypothetical protein